MNNPTRLPGRFAGTLQRYLKARQLQIKAGALYRQLSKHNPDETVSAAQFNQWLHNLQQIDPVSALNLRMGHLVTAKDCGLLGQLTLSCSNLRQALGRYRHYRSLILGPHEVTVTENNQCCHIAWTLPAANSDALLEFILAAFIAYYQSLIGSPLPPLRVGLPVQEPSSAVLYEALLGCSVEFGCPHSYVSIPAKLMVKRIIHADSKRRQQLEVEAETLLKKIRFQQNDPFSEACLFIQKNLSTPPIVAQSVARHLKLSDHRFQILLQQHNVQFRQLVNQIRLDMAKQALNNPARSLSDIAKQLGYSEQSSFIRAFKKWTGLTPGEFRQQ